MSQQSLVRILATWLVQNGQTSGEKRPPATAASFLRICLISRHHWWGSAGTPPVCAI